MIKEIPQNIKELSKNNQKTLKDHNINRNDLTGDFDKSVEVGQKCLSDIFSEKRIDINSYKETPEYIGDDKEVVVSEILKFDPCLILVRPEMLHMTNSIRDFLDKNGFRVNFSIQKKISIEEYFNLYKKEIARNLQNFKLVLPSRTLAYTNMESCIIVFAASKNENSNHLSDLFSAKFKGEEGKESVNTIRGDIIHKEALRLGFDKLEDPVIAMAVDPFATYDSLIKQKDGDFYHLRTSPKFYMLMYTAQGIHCPKYEELPHDLSSILSLNQLLELKSKLEK